MAYVDKKFYIDTSTWNYSRIDKAFASIAVESYLGGVSTRYVESIVGELGIDLSLDTISRLSRRSEVFVPNLSRFLTRKYGSIFSLRYILLFLASLQLLYHLE